VGTWAIDPKLSSARFSVPYMFFARLRGTFGSVEGDLTIDENDPSRSCAHASIDVTTIHTGIALRDAHLRSAQFFHASQFPKMTFRSTHIEQTADDGWDLRGNLTVRDVTKTVVLGTKYHGLMPTEENRRHARFTAWTELDRRDFGLGLHGPGGIVGDLVSVRLEISAIHVDHVELERAS
jgi:polyisoprenoid-binding protein YceI